MYVLPLIASLAGFGAPVPGVRRVYAGTAATRTELGASLWQLDHIEFAERLVTAAEIRALNDLLALPVIEGFRVDLED